MRKSTLLLLATVVACGEPISEDYVVIEGFLDRSPQLACEVIPGPEYLAVTELRAASDSTLMVLDGPGRRLVELDPALRPVWEMEVPSVGPGAVSSPVSMAVLGDTAVAIGERQGLQVIVFSRAGRLIRTLPLGFAPASVAAGRNGDLLVTAMPFGGTPGSLLFRYDATGFQEIPIEPRPFANVFVGALGNTTLAESLADGAVLVVHQFMAPRAYRVGVDGRIDRLRVPTPDATRSSIDYVPEGPLAEEQIQRMLVPASAMSVDPLRSEVYLLTRSGRRHGENTERALLRLDAGFDLLDSYTLDFVARHLAVVAGDGRLFLVDDEDRFHACDIARPSAHADAD